MPACVIIGCTSGYHSNPEKCHHFTLPRDKGMREQWEKAIKPSGITIKPGQSVCGKHFHPTEIMWERKHMAPDGTQLGVTYYKIPRLKKGSVPSIFLWTEMIQSQPDILSDRQVDHITSPDRIGNDTIDRTTTHSVLGEESLREPVVSEGTVARTESMAEQNHPIESIVESTEIIDATSPVLDSNNSTASIPSLTLQQLIESEISMPRGWNKLIVTHEYMPLVVYSITKCVKVEGKFITYGLKEIILKDDMSFQINILGKPVEKKNIKIDLGPIQSIQRLQELLVWLNGSNICIGTRLSDEQNQDIGHAVYKDPSGRWRHMGCSQLCTRAVCLSCRRARKSAMAKSRRIQKRDCAEADRIWLTVPSNDKRPLKLDSWNRKSISTKRKSPPMEQVWIVT